MQNNITRTSLARSFQFGARQQDKKCTAMTLGDLLRLYYFFILVYSLVRSINLFSVHLYVYRAMFN
jgi:hypothetical protein